LVNPARVRPHGQRRSGRQVVTSVLWGLSVVMAPAGFVTFGLGANDNTTCVANHQRFGAAADAMCPATQATIGLVILGCALVVVLAAVVLHLVSHRAKQ